MTAPPRQKKPSRKVPGQPPRLYSRGVVMGYKRSKINQDPNASLVKIEGVNTRADTAFYLGKRVAYVFKAHTESKGSKFRVIWGKVRRAHGNSGVVRCKFTSNLPSTSFGGAVRVMMYPSSI
eukprot:GDKI01020584.1.p1 GENE.GDKI01020584.1~~GDKI01020584.1.p1  ORF type:complete len:131 (-),score=37.49 GDKI01020584.1:159-524(-)